MTGHETSPQGGLGTQSARKRGRPSRKAEIAPPNVPKLLLAAGIEQFARHGFEGVGLRTIAAQVGVNAAMVVHHFGSKQGLWEAAIDDLSATMLRTLEGGPRATAADTAVGRLNEASAHLIDVICDRPELAAFILREVVLENDRSDYSHARLIQPIHDRLAPTIAEYAAECEPSPEPDYLFVALMGAIVSAIASRRLFGRLLHDEDFRVKLQSAISGQVAARAGMDQTGLREEG